MAARTIQPASGGGRARRGSRWPGTRASPLRGTGGLKEGGRAWFATGKLLDAQARERIDGTFDGVCRGGCAWRCGHGRLDSPVWNQPRCIQLAPFTAAVFRADLFRRAGLLDEQFETYLEDVDFGLRCAELGLRRLYVPG